jgi:hypothetical protein
LEKHGLINFNVSPQDKPHARQLFKASTYDKVLINASNKHLLQRSENDYMNQLFEVPVSDTQEATAEPKAMIDPACLRKINILTLKERPLCAYCDANVGFSWRLDN